MVVMVKILQKKIVSRGREKGVVQGRRRKKRQEIRQGKAWKPMKTPCALSYRSLDGMRLFHEKTTLPKNKTRKINHRIFVLPRGHDIYVPYICFRKPGKEKNAALKRRVMAPTRLRNEEKEFRGEKSSKEAMIGDGVQRSMTRICAFRRSRRWQGRPDQRRIAKSRSGSASGISRRWWDPDRETGGGSHPSRNQRVAVQRGPW